MTPKEIAEMPIPAQNDGCYYQHAEGSSSTGYVGGNGKEGVTHCISFITQDHVDCYIRPRVDHAGTWNAPTGYDLETPVRQIVSEETFEKFVDLIATMHPVVAQRIEEERPTYQNCMLRIGTGYGFMNYFIMTMWRMLWCSAQGVELAVWCYDNGYSWVEILAILGLYREGRMIKFYQGTTGMPFEYGDYYPKTLFTMENICTEMPHGHPYYFNTELRQRLQDTDAESIALGQYAETHDITLDTLEENPDAIRAFLDKLR